MNLIEIYVSEVGRRLPQTMRADIEAEIRSALEDMLEERSKKAGQPANDEMVLAMLKEYGDPEKVAASYLPERYLIGPSLYPIFMMVLRIALIVTGVLAAVGLGFAIYQSTLTAQGVFETVLRAAADFFTSLVIALGNIILVFAIIEWALYQSGKKIDLNGNAKKKEWDPHSLTKVMPSNRIKHSEVIIELVGCFIAIILFNFYPGLIGFTPSLNGVVGSGNWAIGFGSAEFVRLLSSAFFHFVPYLTAVWVLTIILNIILLIQGYWNTLDRIISIGLKVINIVIAAAMLAGPSLIALTLAGLTKSLGDAGTAQMILNLVTQVVHGALWLAIIAGSLDVIVRLVRLAQARAYIPR
ncbi:MAG TPA: hypothetical protein VMC09_13185 [Anaerolineales bacterium]|nr:hypothetical protein [Anaerolineales bacterium]